MQNLARRGDPLRDRSLSAPATPQKRLNRSSHLSPSTSIAASPSAAAAADGGSAAAIPPVEMRISFILPLLTVRLSDNKVFGYTMKNLARVDLRKMQLDYASGGGHMDVHLSLESLQIEDEAMQGRLPIADSVADDAKADLLDLRYTSNQDPESPDEVRLRFSRLHVEWHPDTIAALLAFVRLSPASKHFDVAQPNSAVFGGNGRLCLSISAPYTTRHSFRRRRLSCLPTSIAAPLAARLANVGRVSLCRRSRGVVRAGR